MENSERIVLGKVFIPENAKAWMRWVGSDGTVYAQPFKKKVKK